MLHLDPVQFSTQPTDFHLFRAHRFAVRPSQSSFPVGLDPIKTLSKGFVFQGQGQCLRNFEYRELKALDEFVFEKLKSPRKTWYK